MILTDLLLIPPVKVVLDDLRARLSPSLYYHSPEHTLDVVNDVFIFASEDGLRERELELLVIAAAFHDSGFLVENRGHEKLGAERCQRALIDDGGYNAQEIGLVVRMILDTQVVMTPRGPRHVSSGFLPNYLLDADLGNFGTDQFFIKLEQARREEGKELLPFLESTLALLTAHEWLTPAAQRLRTEKWNQNLVALRLKIRGQSL